MPFFPSRRVLLAGMTAAMAGKSLAQDARPAPRSAREPAEIIDDPRVSSFDIGPDDKAWRVFVGLPAVPPPPDGYSVLLSVDGNAGFPIFWHHRENIAPDAPVVLIGVGYPVTTRIDVERRWFDLTSPGMIPADPEQRGRGPGDHPTGGRTAFLNAIADGILPQVAQRTPLNLHDMTIYGHSLGGLFVLHALFTRPTLFRRFAAADPSLWWNAGEAVKEAAAFAGGVQAAGGRFEQPTDLLIARSGDTKGPVGGSPLQQVPVLIETLNRLDGLTVTYRPHPDEDHGSLVRPSALQALQLHLGML